MGKKIGLFLTDIKSAFDRVDKRLLLAKLRRTGLGQQWIDFFSSYLDPRTAHIVLNGHSSSDFFITDMVFQGTVMGPILWMIFFSDISVCTSLYGDSENIFADDLSCFRAFDKVTSNNEILTELGQTQDLIHTWGTLNRVDFDPSKEQFAVLHNQNDSKDHFKLLGYTFDTQLTMAPFICSLATRARNKTSAILRTRYVYTTAGLIQQFKSHVLGLLESFTSGIYHAISTELLRIDQILLYFIHELDLTLEECLLKYNLAPLSTRRDIAILGLLHRIRHKRCHSNLSQLFRFAVSDEVLPRSARHPPLHVHQFYNRHPITHAPTLYDRSLFGQLRIYNLLDPNLVQVNTIKPNWEYCLNSRFVHFALRVG